jgi:hypothetical protein
MPARPRFAAALLAATLASGCSVFRSPAKVTFASDPPGARVLIDRKDSGFVTPCVLALDKGDTRVDFVYPGYATETRELTTDRQFDVILWRDMYLRSEVWRFPLWLNTKDFFTPIKSRRVLVPGRVHVRLERAADST